MKPVAALSAGLVLLAAHTAVAQAQPSARRDSAGIRILTVPRAALSSLPVWHLEGPILRIGEAMGAPEYELNRAAWPWRLSDGRIALTNDHTELRFYDSTGHYLATLGRRGRGPGEYQQVRTLWRLAGDSLLVHDGPLGRLDIRAPDGSMVRTVSVATNQIASQAPDGSRVRSVSVLSSQLVAWSPDGSAFFAPYGFPDVRTPGIRQQQLALRRFANEGTVGDSIATVPGGWYEVVAPGEWRGLELSGDPLLAAGPNGAVFVHGDAMEVTWFAFESGLTAITRVAVARTRVTDADRRANERAKEEMMAAMRARQPNVRIEGHAPRPPSYATYEPEVSDLRVDAEGRAWVQRWSPPGSGTTEWIVFAPRGLPIARITMPARFNPNDIGPDYVLGIATDDDGVQKVTLYSIRR